MKYTDQDIERLASFPSQNPNPVIEVDHVKGSINYMNPAAQKQFPEMTVQGFSHPLFDSIRKRLENQTEFSCEVTVSDRIFEQKIYFISGTDFIRVYSTDITHMKEVEKNLSRLASFPEQNPSPIIEVDMKKNITYFNPAALLHFPDLYEKKFDHIVLNGLNMNFEKFTSGELHNFSQEIRYKDKYYDQRSRLMVDSNVIRMFNLDITQMKLAEEIIREKNKDILDSMNYASRIQKALMPSEKNIDKILKRINKMK